MTAFLVDTNVLSELQRRDPDRGVRLWVDSASDADVFVSVLTLGEIRRGVEQLERRDKTQAVRLGDWLNRLAGSYSDRTLGVTLDIADRWGRITAIRPLPVIDSLLAATALVHDLTLVTRNQADFEGIDGLSLLNPWLDHT